MKADFPSKLRMWYCESRDEKNLIFRAFSHLKDRLRGGYYKEFALYPRRFYKRIEQFDFEKTIDYCFIGGYKTDRKTQLNRQWIIGFIESKFTDSSYLQFTDKNTKENYKVMGNFDFTLKKKGFVPKENPIKQRIFLMEIIFRHCAEVNLRYAQEAMNFGVCVFMKP